MDMTPSQNIASIPVQKPSRDFRKDGLDSLRALAEQCEALRATLASIEEIGDESVQRKMSGLYRDLDAFAPAVTFIGQIKSGKTTLVNAMACQPDLLPSDVNPWTSVITSIHLNAVRPDDAPAATFQFFAGNEWDHLVQSGGRIGELSARMGADRELERLRRQVTAMYEKSRSRLGKRFELLLGQTHSYGSVDSDLIQRYVCLGDDFGPEGDMDRQGQFADITKAADLYLDGPHVPISLTLRDTPGMNDTFMMREQVTIRAIRDSKICVVVLSAHQALNSVDMALIRMISAVKSRQVIVFVNRIDELSDPGAQMDEIRDSLTRTLAQHSDSGTPLIVFGSALWANAALSNTIADLPAASITALRSLAHDALAEADVLEPSNVWTFSGVPALFGALGERIAEQAGPHMLNGVRARGANIAAGLQASNTLVSLAAHGTQLRKMDAKGVERLLKDIEAKAQMRLDRTLESVFGAFERRLSQAHQRFLTRALEALIQHLEDKGDSVLWTYGADGLRILMRTSYQVMRKSYVSQVDRHFQQVAEELTQAYGQIFDVTSQNFSVTAPEAPHVPPPVTIAQTIALDVKTSWWKSWWRARRGYRAFANDFHDLIETETRPMVQALRDDQVMDLKQKAQLIQNTFLQDQRDVLNDMMVRSELRLEDLNDLFGLTSQAEREALLQQIFADLGMSAEVMREAV